MNTIKRRDAHSLGLKRFFTGKPCTHGHLAERYVSTGGCVACHQQFSSAYNNTFTTTSKAIVNVRVAVNVHPLDAEKVYQLVDFLNKARGLPPAVRPAPKGGTPWELYVQSETRNRPLNGRPSLATLEYSARNRGITPHEYSPGVKRFTEWAQPIKPPNFAAADPAADGYAPDER